MSSAAQMDRNTKSLYISQQNARNKKWRKEQIEEREREGGWLNQKVDKTAHAVYKSFLIQLTLMNEWLKVLSVVSWEEHSHTPTLTWR